MPIPDYESLMLPLLERVASAGELTTRQAVEDLGKALALSNEELSTMLPSGVSTTFGNRVGWAKTYLKQAGMLDQPRRGVLRITPRGRELVGSRPKRIDNTLLMSYPEFVEFRRRTRSTRSAEGSGAVATVVPAENDAQSPSERIEVAIRELNASLSDDLVAAVRGCPPAFFEELVVKLLLRMGYGGSRQEAGRAVGRSGDGGIDGIINEDRLGLDAVYIQAKRWEAAVGRPEVMRFVGALAGQRASKGVFLTTSTFTREARDYAAQSQYRVVLVDGERLAQLMIEFNLGVTTSSTIEVKRIDSDFFNDE